MQVSALTFREPAGPIGTILVEHYRNGKLLTVRFRSNLIPKAGKAAQADVMITGGTDDPSHVAYGIGTDAAHLDDTTLGMEIDREAATTSRVTTTHENDTAQYTKTFSIGSTLAVTEAGLFNHASAGDLYARQKFSAIKVEDGDSLTLTWKLQY